MSTWDAVSAILDRRRQIKLTAIDDRRRLYSLQQLEFNSMSPSLP